MTLLSRAMDVSADAGFRRSPFWVAVLILLVVGQGWFALRLFGPGLPIARLTDDSPVLDGKHPLHAYHGLLGNRVWHERQQTTCYDPAFQAGYLKTPVFDAGSRPAELFYFIGGPTAGSYKVGLAVCCLMAPLAFALAGRGIGLGAGGACLTALIGATLWWAPSSQALLMAGDVDLLVGGMCVPVYLAWLSRFGRTPGPVEWLVLTLSATVGWYMQPLLMVGVIPIALLYQLWAFRGVRFAWHLGLLAANGAAFAANGYWLWDWAIHLSMFVPYGGEDAPRSLWPLALQEWEAFLPTDSADLAIGGIGLVGLLMLVRRNGSAAGLLAAGSALLILAGGAGRVWPTVAEFGTARLLTIAVWCLAIPGAYALAALAGGIGHSSGFRPMGIVWLAIGLGGMTYGLDLPNRWTIAPLELGLGTSREDVVRTLREKSTPEGRILWEDGGPNSGWSAFLPELTQRPFIGGLSAEISIDHLQIRLADGKLIGRPIADWTDEELHRFLDQYNVTRAVARTPESKNRFQKLPGAFIVAELKNCGMLFAFDRRPTFVLKGQAEVTQMDWKRIALANVEPDENGHVVLSLHHHAGWRVSPDYVAVERDVDVNDPIPMLRLRVRGPVSRLTLTWRGD